MSASLTLLLVMGVMYAAGFYLVLAERLFSKIIGILLVGNATNLLILIMSGRPGNAPLIGASEGELADPLPQALILTAIVITFGLTSFLLALVYRRWWLTRLGERSDERDADIAEHDDAIDVFESAHAEDEALERSLESEDDDPMDDDDFVESSAETEPSGEAEPEHPPHDEQNGGRTR